MRIAFLSSSESVPWGGSEYCWAAAAEKLAQRGVEVRVSVKRWEKPVAQIERLRSLGCKILLRTPPSLAWRAARRVFPLPDYVSSHMQELSAGANLVVISQGENRDGLAWIEAAKRQGRRYVTIAQGGTDYIYPDDSLAQRLASVYEAAAAACFVSDANVALSRRQFGTALSKARLIRNPFNVRYDASPTWPTNGSGGLRLACVGRLDVGTKRQDLICDVLALPHWRSRDVRVSLFGGGPNERTLRWFADSLNLHSVTFAGPVEDIERVWSENHALLLPSRHEGMPLTLVEAMLCGRAAIVTDVGGNRELVRDNANGFLAKAPTVELLDEAMNRAWENRHRLREMGEQAGRDVRAWVGPDPVENFVQELIALAEGRAPL